MITRSHRYIFQSGSEYIVYNDGMSPNKTALEANVRNILASVEFSYDDMGPGKITAQIPYTQSNGTASVWKDKPLGAGSGVDPDKLLTLHNKRPQYDEKRSGHVLDFGGRVNMPSIKNFQMQCDVRNHCFLVTIDNRRYSRLVLVLHNIASLMAPTLCCSSAEFLVSLRVLVFNVNAIKTRLPWMSR